MSRKWSFSSPGPKNRFALSYDGGNFGELPTLYDVPAFLLAAGGHSLYTIAEEVAENGKRVIHVAVIFDKKISALALNFNGNLPTFHVYGKGWLKYVSGFPDVLSNRQGVTVYARALAAPSARDAYDLLVEHKPSAIIFSGVDIYKNLVAHFGE